MTTDNEWGMLVPAPAGPTILGSWMTLSFQELANLLKLPPNVQILAVRPGPDAHSLALDMAGKLPPGAVQAIYKCTMVRDTKFTGFVSADAP